MTPPPTKNPLENFTLLVRSLDSWEVIKSYDMRALFQAFKDPYFSPVFREGGSLDVDAVVIDDDLVFFLFQDDLFVAHGK